MPLAEVVTGVLGQLEAHAAELRVPYQPAGLCLRRGVAARYNC